MPLIVIDGPEKAGKSTLARYLVERMGASIRKWGPIAHGADYLYAEALAEDTPRVRDGEWVVWDRSWISEHVYAALMPERFGRLGLDPWLGEWLYGRAVRSLGTVVVLLGPGVDELRAARDYTDLPVDPADEVRTYGEYAVRFKWPMFTNGRDQQSLDYVFDVISYRTDATPDQPPVVAGSSRSRIVVVGEARSSDPQPPRGAWLPFTSRYTTQFGRLFGDTAVTDVLWTNAADDPRVYVDNAKAVVLCGAEARRWYDADPRPKRVVSYQRVLTVPHPSWLFRWGAGLQLVPETERKIQAFIHQGGEDA